MRARNVNAILWMISALLCAGAVGAIALGVTLQLDGDVGDLSNRDAIAPTTHSSSTQLASFELILARQWRQSLTESSSSMPAEAATPGGVSQLTLVGTIGNSLALLRHADGSVEVKAVGETIDGAEVLAVRPGEIDIRKDGANAILRKPKEPEP